MSQRSPCSVHQAAAAALEWISRNWVGRAMCVVDKQEMMMMMTMLAYEFPSRVSSFLTQLFPGPCPSQSRENRIISLLAHTRKDLTLILKKADHLICERTQKPCLKSFPGSLQRSKRSREIDAHFFRVKGTIWKVFLVFIKTVNYDILVYQLVNRGPDPF